jgi:hypothetical protein
MFEWYLTEASAASRLDRMSFRSKMVQRSGVLVPDVMACHHCRSRGPSRAPMNAQSATMAPY